MGSHHISTLLFNSVDKAKESHDREILYHPKVTEKQPTTLGWKGGVLGCDAASSLTFEFYRELLNACLRSG